jgi:hypothetical protein
VLGLIGSSNCWVQCFDCSEKVVAMKCTDVYSFVKDFGEVGLRRRLAFRLHLSPSD